MSLSVPVRASVRRCIGIIGRISLTFPPSCLTSSAYLMLWPVERGEEVPVGWSYWCFLQDRGRILVFQREGRFLFWVYPPPPSLWLRVDNVLTCGEIGVEAFFWHPRRSDEQADSQPMHARCTRSRVNRLRAAVSLEGVWCVLFHLRVCHSASPQQPRVSWTRRRTSRWARLSLLSLSMSFSSSRPLSLSIANEGLVLWIFHPKLHL